MDLQRALYLLLMSEKFQQVRIKILLPTDFTLNDHVVDFLFICSSQNWLKPIKVIRHFHNLPESNFKLPLLSGNKIHSQSH